MLIIIRSLIISHRIRRSFLLGAILVFYGIDAGGGAAAAAVPIRKATWRPRRGGSCQSKNNKRQWWSLSYRTTSTGGITDCEALSFLFQDYDAVKNGSKQRPSETKQQQQQQPTLVGQVSHYFDNVLIMDDDVYNNKSDKSHINNSQQLNPIDIDIPQLLNACRHFADAMVQIDQRQSARDMRQNIRKVEQYGDPTTKSMRELLTREKLRSLHEYHYAKDNHNDDNKHNNKETLVRLGEHSCAIGLLWIRRSLEFQYELFHQLVHHNNDKAASTAYDRTLRRYHGWGLQQIYAMALAATAGNVAATTAQLGGFFAQSKSLKQQQQPNLTKQQYDAIRRDLQHLMDLWRPLLKVWNDIFDELNLQDMRRV